jgi:hypothetical protein
MTEALADGCLWETGGRNALEQPAINCGAKGICYVELIACGASHDLHSSNATVVPNPAWRLTWALATLKGLDERILIPGFYDRVRPPLFNSVNRFPYVRRSREQPPLHCPLLASTHRACRRICGSVDHASAACTELSITIARSSAIPDSPAHQNQSPV